MGVDYIKQREADYQNQKNVRDNSIDMNSNFVILGKETLKSKGRHEGMWLTDKIFNELDKLLKEKENIENIIASGERIKNPTVLRHKSINKLIAMEYKKIMVNLSNNSKSEFIQYRNNQPYKLDKSLNKAYTALGLS